MARRSSTLAWGWHDPAIPHFGIESSRRPLDPYLDYKGRSAWASLFAKYFRPYDNRSLRWSGIGILKLSVDWKPPAVGRATSACISCREGHPRCKGNQEQPHGQVTPFATSSLAVLSAECFLRTEQFPLRGGWTQVPVKASGHQEPETNDAEQRGHPDQRTPVADDRICPPTGRQATPTSRDAATFDNHHRAGRPHPETQSRRTAARGR